MNRYDVLRATPAVALMFASMSMAPMPVSAQAHQDHILVTPEQVEWSESDVQSLPPGVKIAQIQGKLSEPGRFTARLRFPANYELPAHHHPAVEHVTVISGTFNMGAGDKLDKTQTTALPPGSVLIMQPGMRHYAWTEKETVVQLTGEGPWQIVYVNPEDDPRKQ